MPGDSVGVGGAGGFRYRSDGFTASSQAEQNRILAEIAADREAIYTRGQSGADADIATDLSVSFGSISFDSQRNDFHFGNGEIGNDQVDFFSVAVHEIAHVLGFGTSRSWFNLTGSGRFAGPAATAVYLGDGNVPVIGGHWASSVREVVGQPTAMTAELFTGRSAVFSELDFAALDDIGWDLTTSRFTARGSTVYADDGNYAPGLRLRGSIAGDQTIAADPISVTNVAPNLELAAIDEVFSGELFAQTDFGILSDNGFDNNSASPPTFETFTASINWGDGIFESLPVTVDQFGSKQVPLTLASFDIEHVYDQPGTYTIRIDAVDDDGGTVAASTEIVVAARDVAPYQNDLNPFDVNSDGVVEVLDALLVINRLRRNPGGGLDPAIEPPSSAGQWDVDGNNQIEVLDALLVVNFIRRAALAGERVSADELVDAAETVGRSSGKDFGLDEIRRKRHVRTAETMDGGV